MVWMQEAGMSDSSSAMYLHVLYKLQGDFAPVI